MNISTIHLPILQGASRRHYENCVELPPLGVFCMNLLTEEIQLNSWQSLSVVNSEQLNDLQDILHIPVKVELSIKSPWLIRESFEDISHGYNFESILKDCVKQSSVDIFERLLDNENVVSVCAEVIMRLEKSVLDRISATPPVCRECLHSGCNRCDHARIGILFSGGIDCTILAVLTDKLLDASQPIDLINVSFEKINRSSLKTQINYNTPDRVSAKEALGELQQMNRNR